MTTSIASPVGSDRYMLGEGVIWDSTSGRTLWVDVEDGRVYAALDGEFERATCVAEFSDSVGCVLPKEDGLLVATENSITWLGKDGSIEAGAPLFIADGQRRLNDGIIDAQGRVIVGTLRRGVDEPSEELLRLEHDGEVTVLRSGIRLANGLAFEPNGRILFSVDSWARTVSWCDYDANPAEWRTAFVTEGIPDGMCADADGYLWIAMWGSGQIVRYTTSGRVIERVQVGTQLVTSCAFTGEQLDRMVITTARRKRQPSPAGSLFAVSFGTRVRGALDLKSRNQLR